MALRTLHKKAFQRANGMYLLATTSHRPTSLTWTSAAESTSQSKSCRAVNHFKLGTEEVRETASQKSASSKPRVADRPEYEVAVLKETVRIGGLREPTTYIYAFRVDVIEDASLKLRSADRNGGPSCFLESLVLADFTFQGETIQMCW